MSKQKRQESPLGVGADLGQRIRYWRLKAGLTQAQVEERAGTAHNAVSRIERGEVENPHFDTLERIAVVLGLSLDELQLRAVPETQPQGDRELEQLSERIGRLPLKQREAVVESLQRLLDAME